MTQAQLAEKMELTASAVSRWMNGHNASDDLTIRKIEAILELAPGTLDSPELSAETRLNESSPAYLFRSLPANAEAVLTLSWHGFTREVALSRDPERIGKNVLQALSDIDLLYRQQQAGIVVTTNFDPLLEHAISSAPGVSAAASAGAASATRLVAPESSPTPATGAPSGHTRGPRPAADPAP